MPKQLLVYTPELGLNAIDGEPSLETLQRHVGGYIELVKCPHGIEAWCDEEGLLKDLPPSIAVKRQDGLALFLRGPVVFVVPRATSPEDSIARVQLISLPIRSFQSTAIFPQPSTVQ